MTIRNEQAGDVEAIATVTKAAFANHPYSQQTESFIIDALRAAGALTVSLVAEVEGAVVGHIAFSPLTISDGSRDWYALGPVSVLPAFQRQGIGSALIQQGLAILKSAGAQGCVLVGRPEYYQRFGFRHVPDLVMEGVPPEVLLALPFGEHTACGTVIHHEAFSATG